MKKIKYILLVFTFVLLLNIIEVNAFSINANSTVYLNSTVAVTIEAKGLIGRFDISSSNQGVLAGSDSKWIEDSTITTYFSAVSEGKATITVNAVDVSDTSGNDYTGSRSITINVIKKSSTPSINVNPNYSKNNFLSSLSIDGYTLTPSFDKNTLEYTVTLDPGTEKVVINADLEDKTASVKGSGEVSVTEGINTLNIIVTAENGNEKTYKILATVEEKDPINVEINNKKYTVVKKKELIENRENYRETTVKIDSFDIPALYNDTTKVTLVGLKDSEGNISLFSYNSKNGKYNEYKEFSFDLMNLYIHENNKSDLKKIKIKINDIEVVGYKIEGIDDYCLLYATNTNTGNESYYLYDKKENSVQRYNSSMIEKVTKEKDRYLSLSIVLSCVCFLLMLFLLIIINKQNNQINK